MAGSSIKHVRERVELFKVNSASLFGVNGVVIIGYGRFNDIAIKNAIDQAHQAVAGRLVEAIEVRLKEQVQVERR